MKYVIETEEHPFIKAGELCRACLTPIKVGDAVTLIPLGPGKDEEERARMMIGLVYTAKCALVHWDCCDLSLRGDKKVQET